VIRSQPSTPHWRPKATASGTRRCSWPIATGHPAPAPPPTLGEFLRQVARLGGYLGRKHDGPPGPEVMWRGLRRVFDFSLAWATYNALEGKTCV